MKKHDYGMAVHLEIKTYFSVHVWLHSLKTQPHPLCQIGIASKEVNHNLSLHASCLLNKFECSELFKMNLQVTCSFSLEFSNTKK